MLWYNISTERCYHHHVSPHRWCIQVVSFPSHIQHFHVGQKVLFCSHLTSIFSACFFWMPCITINEKSFLQCFFPLSFLYKDHIYIEQDIYFYRFSHLGGGSQQLHQLQILLTSLINGLLDRLKVLSTGEDLKKNFSTSTQKQYLVI